MAETSEQIGGLVRLREMVEGALVDGDPGRLMVKRALFVECVHVWVVGGCLVGVTKEKDLEASPDEALANLRLGVEDAMTGSTIEWPPEREAMTEISEQKSPWQLLDEVVYGALVDGELNRLSTTSENGEYINVWYAGETKVATVSRKGLAAAPEAAIDEMKVDVAVELREYHIDWPPEAVTVKEQREVWLRQGVVPQKGEWYARVPGWASYGRSGADRSEAVENMMSRGCASRKNEAQLRDLGYTPQGTLTVFTDGTHRVDWWDGGVVSNVPPEQARRVRQAPRPACKSCEQPFNVYRKEVSHDPRKPGLCADCYLGWEGNGSVMRPLDERIQDSKSARETKTKAWATPGYGDDPTGGV